MTRECIICGAAFEPGRYNQKVCGAACRRKHKSNMVMASTAKNRTASRAAAKRFRDRHPDQIAAYQAGYQAGRRHRDPSLPPTPSQNTGGNMTDRTRFESLARRAEAMRRAGGSDAEWWTGYARGLRRDFHGEAFGTEEEHALWLSLVERPDPTGAARGAGYRAGLLAMESDVEPPAPGPADGRPDARLHNPDPTYLRSLIERAGLSQRAAARALGIDERSMRAYVADRATKSAETAPYLVQYGLERLAAAGETAD